MNSPTVTIMKKVEIGGRQGAVFGFMEGIVMLMGVLIGLATTGERKIAVIGVLVAGVADAFANSAGFFASEESEGIHTKKEIRLATLWTLIATIIAAIVIVIPLIMLPIKTAIYVSFVIALLTLALIGNYISKITKENKLKSILKYLIIGVVTAIATHYIGQLIVSLV